MFRIVSLTMLAAVMAVGISGNPAQAQERERGERGERSERRDRGMREVCSIVRKCRFDDGRRRCERVRVCKMVRIRR